MLLIPFLESVEDYQRLKAVRAGERVITRLETSMSKEIGRLFRKQGSLFLSHLPETFDITDAERAWIDTQIETFPEFRDAVIRFKRRAAYTGIRTIERELSTGVLKEEAKSAWGGTFNNTPTTQKKKPGIFNIDFSGFDEDAYQHIEQNAGQRISGINETTRKEIRDIIADGFKGEVQDDGTTKYKTYQQIAKDIKDKFSDFAAPAPQGHIRNRAELVAVTEIRDGYETSKAGVRDSLEARGWQILKKWNNMGDDKVSDGCRDNGNAGWIDNKESFPSGHQQPPRFPGCRCNCTSKVGSRKEQSGLPQDRWVVTRRGDTVTVKRNAKYV